MNKRERIEQHRIALKTIRSKLREWAKARRLVHSGMESARHQENAAFYMVLGMRALAWDLGVIPLHGDDDQKIEARVTRIAEADITRRPFRAVKAA